MRWENSDQGWWLSLATAASHFPPARASSTGGVTSHISSRHRDSATTTLPQLRSEKHIDIKQYCVYHDLPHSFPEELITCLTTTGTAG